MADGPITPCGWLVDALLAAGVDLTEIEAFLDRPIAARTVEGLALPSKTFFRFFEWGAARTETPDLGIRIARQLSARDFGLLGYLLENSSTLGQWLTNVTTYHGIYALDARLTATHSGSVTRLCYDPISIPGFVPLQDIWCTIGMIVHAIRLGTKRDWVPLRCHFTTAEPADTGAFQALLGPQLEFRSSQNCIELSESDLSLPIPGADPVLFAILKGQADDILATISQESELVNRLRLLITAHLAEGSFDTKKAARALNKSVRNLHRELDARGTSFRRLRHTVLHETARAHLADSTIQVTDIAQRLGYSETSAFSRAFRVMEGLSPREYRDKLRSGI